MPTLQFKGKTFVQNYHLAVNHHQLIPKRELNQTDKVSLHDNLVIQGDNLIALKALLPTYAGRVKCIYIDPLVEMENYANTITAERVRRVINGVPSAKNEALKQGTGGTFSYFELGPTIEMESLLRGNNLPSYTEFARYLFYISTGEEFTESPVNEATGFIGESKNYEVYLIYKPDIEWLKRNALTLQGCQSLPKFKGKQRLVFAPCKYVDDETCRDYRIDFCQLPYEIYRMQQ
ncbi:Adenine specific DNA methylase Mod [Bacteroidales bacterium Barb6XT]|nr:Adenine specific DNA methylase Mod [Bacteroidales bacterium Barb6XT]